MIGILIIISLAVFALLYAAPGSVEQVLLGTTPSTPETLAAIRERYHLDDPFLVQYWDWAKNAFTLDFGRSIRTDEPVGTLLKERFALSLELGIYAFGLAALCGIPLGIIAALRKRRAIDRAIVGFSVLGVSAPAFASGIFLLYVFAVLLEWFPAYGQGDTLSERIWHLTLPAITLALTITAVFVKVTRAAMIDELDRDHMTFGRARGLPARRLIERYALRNALIPVVTAGGLILVYMLSGAVLVETVFALPGIGSLLVEAVAFKDVPVVQGVAMLIACVVLSVNLLVDLLYLAIDPRIRFGAAAR